MFKNKDIQKQINPLAVAFETMTSITLIFAGTFLGISLTTLLPYVIGILISAIIFVVIFLIFHFLMGKKHPVWALIITLIIIVLLNILFLPKELKDFSINGLKGINGWKEIGKEKNGKEVTPPVVDETKVTYVCNLEELNKFSGDGFFERTGDKWEDELKRLEGIYNKCKEDKGGQDDFYTAVINYKGGLAKAWFGLGESAKNDKYFNSALDSITIANTDTGGKDNDATNSTRKAKILKIWYDELVVPALKKILKDLKSRTSPDTESLIRYNNAINTVENNEKKSLIMDYDTSIANYILTGKLNS